MPRVRPGDKVIVVHCGVDTEVFQPRTEPTSYERGESPFTILCIGTLHEVKGQTYLIDACRLLHGRGIDFVCRFVADGPDLAKLTEQAAQAGIADRVHFHGRVTREEIAALLRDADVMAAPSVPTSDGRREGIPVVLMEAMGSGVPVVASDLSGIPELVVNEQCGLSGTATRRRRAGKRIGTAVPGPCAAPAVQYCRSREGAKRI